MKKYLYHISIFITGVILMSKIAISQQSVQQYIPDSPGAAAEMKRLQALFDEWAKLSDTERYVKELLTYSPKIAKEFEASFQEKYDLHDLNVTLNIIKVLKKDFEKWDTLTTISRYHLERANWTLWVIVSNIYKKNTSPEVKAQIFDLYQKEFQTDGKHLASIFKAIPINAADGPRKETEWTTDFLTPELWALFDRTDDPTVVAGVASLVYDTNDEFGYQKLKEKADKINVLPKKTTAHRLMQYQIGLAFSMREVDRRKKEHPDEPGIPQFGPPSPMWHSEIDRFRNNRKLDWIFEENIDKSQKQ